MPHVSAHARCRRYAKVDGVEVFCDRSKGHAGRGVPKHRDSDREVEWLESEEDL
jgi:hypothetical protein